jgi:hypothetical protein
MSRRRNAQIAHRSNLAPASRAVGGIVCRLCGGALLLGRGETLSPYLSNPQISRKTCRTTLRKLRQPRGEERATQGTRTRDGLRINRP